jgi:hypothetical protein
MCLCVCVCVCVFVCVCVYAHIHICVQLASFTYSRSASKKGGEMWKNKKKGGGNVQLASLTYTPKWRVVPRQEEASRFLCIRPLATSMRPKLLVCEVLSY